MIGPGLIRTGSDALLAQIADTLRAQGLAVPSQEAFLALNVQNRRNLLFRLIRRQREDERRALRGRERGGRPRQTEGGDP